MRNTFKPDFNPTQRCSITVNTGTTCGAANLGHVMPERIFRCDVWYIMNFIYQLFYNPRMLFSDGAATQWRPLQTTAK
jgi:hypothetical protein